MYVSFLTKDFVVTYLMNSLIGCLFDTDLPVSSPVFFYSHGLRQQRRPSSKRWTWVNGRMNGVFSNPAACVDHPLKKSCKHTDIDARAGVSVMRRQECARSIANASYMVKPSTGCINSTFHARMSPLLIIEVSLIFPRLRGWNFTDDREDLRHASRLGRYSRRGNLIA